MVWIEIAEENFIPPVRNLWDRYKIYRRGLSLRLIAEDAEIVD